MVKIVTHNSGFHADDVFAVATLILSLPEDTPVEIVRTREDVEISSADYVVDVGGVYDSAQKRFDHHQTAGAGKRENGIPYASFGLVWREYGEYISGSKEIRDIIEQKLVMFVDALDNGVSIVESRYEDLRPYDISDYFYSYWIDEQVDPQEIDRIFKRVVSLAENLLKREVEKARRIIEEGKIVESIYEKTVDKRIITLDKHLAWGKVMIEKPEPLIVIYPTSDGEKWNAKTVRVELNSFETRILFPESWAGKADGELSAVSGVSDAVFCHRARFLVVAKSKEGAITLAQKALEQ